MNKVKCPSCKGHHYIKKGKTKNGQFQRLQCKGCNKRFQVEVYYIESKIETESEEIRIVKHPDGAFSINLVRFINIGKKNERAENKEYLISKVNSYREIVSFSRKFQTTIDPHEIELDRLLSDELIIQINTAFQSNISQHIINLLENMARGLKWRQDV